VTHGGEVIRVGERHEIGSFTATRTRSASSQTRAARIVSRRRDR
jgi:hypothetical protein